MNSPVNDIIDNWLSSIDVAHSTKCLYRRTLMYYINFLVKNNGSISIPISADVIRFKTSLVNQRLSAATIDNYIAAIRSFYKWSQENEYYDRNPARDIKRLRDGWNRVYIKSYLTTNQVFDLINASGDKGIIEKRNTAIIKLMCFTGLRCIEISRLTISDLRFASGRYWLQIQRKGHFEAGSTIPLTDTIVESLLCYLENRIEIDKDSSPLFVNYSHRSYNTRLTTVFISKMIKSNLRKIGLNDRRYCAHSLRHTAASLALLAGSELYEIQYMLGHSSPTQTEHYLKSLGKSLGNEGAAILHIDQFISKQEEKFRKKRKKE